MFQLLLYTLYISHISACFLSVGDNGAYNISASGSSNWLSSGPYAFNLDRKWRSTSDGTLQISNVSISMEGTDELGEYSDHVWTLTADNITMEAALRDYSSPDIPAIMFIQRFPQGLQGASTDVQKVISKFPTFQLHDPDTPLGYLSFGGLMLGDMNKKAGRWGPKALINDGLESGPLTLFDKTGNAMLIAPYNNFMAASLLQDGSNVNWGIMGGVDSLPAGFEYKTLAFCSQNGIGDLFTNWGAKLRTLYNKTDDVLKVQQSNDVSLTQLGVWTDNGAYYYYKTRDNNTNYQDTLLAIQSYGLQMKIPYRYFQLDSWFYPKDNIGAVTLWDSMETVFPKSIEDLQNHLRLPLVAHNRYWSVNSTYAKQNGGEFDFIFGTNVSLPNDQKFWDFLFSRARNNWGLIVYEQDWLNVQLLSTQGLMTSLTTGRDWLMQMGSSAARNGLKIQYCMSLPRHALQSLELPVVTQIRVSNDYHLSEDQWKIGVTSHLANALGLAPSKDTFWTTTKEIGNKYNKEEKNPTLQVVVSTLSRGPVGPGDGIGLTNRSILMGCCNEDGLILKPFRPARAIDDQILEMAFADGQGARGEVWSTYSIVNDQVYGIILAAGLTADYTITAQKLGFLSPTLPFPFQPSVLYSVNGVYVNFNSTDTYTIKSADCKTNGENFCLFYTAPIFYFG
ncbi:hypothetical protein Bpfe_007051 [Biomphalaria pfeifferi]|uniref:Uncharacterized protein n=1 Tax=Biomphalaria pfeifferi TaxID=112525 RepID=A0AAD8FGD8_BIOPF|nr:hypothetical protein Bpfe_007051 [Biomphalaria pfeifferi]